jgi:hypothetical protein
LVDA